MLWHVVYANTFSASHNQQVSNPNNTTNYKAGYCYTAIYILPNDVVVQYIDRNCANPIRGIKPCPDTKEACAKSRLQGVKSCSGAYNPSSVISVQATRFNPRTKPIPTRVLVVKFSPWIKPSPTSVMVMKFSPGMKPCSDAEETRVISSRTNEPRSIEACWKTAVNVAIQPPALQPVYLRGNLLSAW